MNKNIDIETMSNQLQSYLDMGMKYDDFHEDEKKFMEMFMTKNYEKTETNKKNGNRRKQTKNLRIRKTTPQLPDGN